MTLVRLSIVAGAVLIPLLPAAAHGVQEEVQRIAALMELGDGMQLADVGAGDGEFAEALATLVGPGGHVFVNELDDGELHKIRRRIERSGLHNMTAVEGGVKDAGLPDDCCDGILLRNVYHHMSEPEAMAASLQRALRHGGRLVVVEKLERGGHGISLDDLVDGLTGAGFRLVSRHDEWGGHEEYHAAVFALSRRSGVTGRPRPSAR